MEKESERKKRDETKRVWGREREIFSDNNIIEKRCLNPISGLSSVDPLPGVLTFRSLLSLAILLSIQKNSKTILYIYSE